MKLLNLAVVLSLPMAPVRLPAERSRGESAPPVAIYMTFEGAHSGRAVDAMRREVETLTKPGGLRLSWRALEDREPEQVFSDLVVVKFHGKCNMEGIQLLFSELGPEPAGGALGFTRTSDKQILPFSELECDRIRRSIAPMAVGASPDERESLLGRAMGRVLAHELFHIFANTDKHGREGVAKTRYNRQDLVSDRFRFDAKDSSRMERH